MRPYVGFCGTGAEMRALSALDVALWDIAGKAQGRAICDLLGGRTREAIAVYNTCAGPSYVSKTSAVRPENFGTRIRRPTRGATRTSTPSCTGPTSSPRRCSRWESRR